VSGRPQPRKRQRGQVLVLFAISFIVLVGFVALVIDIGNVYSVQRYEHSTADSAALAGAQQMYVVDPVTGKQTRSTNPSAACQKALDNAFQALSGASAPTNLCGTGWVLHLAVPATPYQVSVKAGSVANPLPAGLCVTCDPTSSVLVSIVRPQLRTFLAGIFGQTTWSPGRASVAGSGFGPSFAIQVLQYPGTPTECDDIMLNGSGTIVKVVNGDVGTNTGVKNGGVLGQGVYQLDPTFRVWQYDTTTVCRPPFPVPSGHLSSRILDPGYTYPVRAGGTTYNTLAAGQDTAANCGLQKATVPSQYKVGGTSISAMPAGPAGKVTCYMPGIYNAQLNGGKIGNAWLLEPGVYFFDGGVKTGNLGAFVGGWQASPSRGVALVFPETSGILTSNGIALLALNGGTKFLNAAGSEAAAAVGFNGALINTALPPPGSGYTPELPITLFVSKGVTTNATNVGGNGSLYIGGVQYTPTDQVTITGNSSGGTNQVGMIIAWTISYSGNTTITENGPTTSKPTISRLDAACSGTDQINPLCFP
jgi:Flp pilus assembly protein TadG